MKLPTCMRRRGGGWLHAPWRPDTYSAQPSALDSTTSRRQPEHRIPAVVAGRCTHIGIVECALDLGSAEVARAVGVIMVEGRAPVATEAVVQQPGQLRHNLLLRARQHAPDGLACHLLLLIGAGRRELPSRLSGRPHWVPARCRLRPCAPRRRRRSSRCAARQQHGPAGSHFGGAAAVPPQYSST
jgi:hypothetical protein